MNKLDIFWKRQEFIKTYGDEFIFSEKTLLEFLNDTDYIPIGETIVKKSINDLNGIEYYREIDSSDILANYELVENHIDFQDIKYLIYRTCGYQEDDWKSYILLPLKTGMFYKIKIIE